MRQKGHKSSLGALPVPLSTTMFRSARSARGIPRLDAGRWAIGPAREAVTRLPGPASRVCRFALRVTAVTEARRPLAPVRLSRTPAIPPRQPQAPRQRGASGFRGDFGPPGRTGYAADSGSTAPGEPVRDHRGTSEPLLTQPSRPGTVYAGGFGLMGCPGGLWCTNRSRKPKSSRLLTPGGRGDRCQRQRGLTGRPTAEADTPDLASGDQADVGPSRPGAHTLAPEGN